MTKNQIEALIHYLNKGLSKKEISELTGIQLGTIKAYCSRHNISTARSKCEYCGKNIEQTAHRKQRRFCSDVCRWSWWNSHPELISRKTECRVCETCGKQYDAYKKDQKFCSRACYIASRRKTDE